MCNKSSIFTVLISSIFLISACTNYGNDNLLSDNSIHSSSIGDNFDDETLLVATIPTEFMCFDEIYITNNEEIDTLAFGTMIGYLVNESDLDFWKSKDNNDNLVYAIGNGVYRKIYEGQENLKNRYELYSQNEAYECLAIKGYTGNFILYYRQGGE